MSETHHTPSNPDVQLPEGGILAEKFSRKLTDAEWQAMLKEEMNRKPSDFIYTPKIGYDPVLAQLKVQTSTEYLNSKTGSITKTLSPEMEKVLGLDPESIKKMTFEDLCKGGNISIR